MPAGIPRPGASLRTPRPLRTIATLGSLRPITRLGSLRTVTTLGAITALGPPRPAAAGATTRAAPHPLHHAGRELFQFAAVELAVTVAVERQRPLHEPLGRGRAARSASLARPHARTTTWATSLAWTTGTTRTALARWPTLGRAAGTTRAAASLPRRHRRPPLVVGDPPVAVGIEREQGGGCVLDLVGVEAAVVIRVEGRAERITRRPFGVAGRLGRDRGHEEEACDDRKPGGMADEARAGHEVHHWPFRESRNEDRACRPGRHRFKRAAEAKVSRRRRCRGWKFRFSRRITLRTSLPHLPQT